MKIGIQISSFRPILKTAHQLRTACTRIREMGCDLVQLQWIDPEIPIQTIADTLRTEGIHSVSVQDFITEVQKDFAYYTQLNALTGGTWVCVSRIPDDLKSRDGLYIYASNLRKMAEALAPIGQRICFHPVATDFAQRGDLAPVETLLEIMPELMICADLYHLNKSGRNINQWLKTYAGRVCMVHFKDAITHCDGTEELVPAGQGDIDWTDVAKTCRETGVEYAFAEQERWQGDPFDRLEEAFRFINAQT